MYFKNDKGRGSGFTLEEYQQMALEKATELAQDFACDPRPSVAARKPNVAPVVIG